jgi:hypothetical protein
MSAAIIILLGIIVGLLIGGYASAVIGGLKTKIAQIEMKAATDAAAIHGRIDQIAAKLL